ncbi:MAG: hypothetical protein VKJ64_08895 [Leptolyngbyaceae bacterium]|nr:hypothetical protein [Leptolyngbyaceae bacterium]
MFAESMAKPNAPLKDAIAHLYSSRAIALIRRGDRARDEGGDRARDEGGR